jgi:3-oxoacyl-[acyl-carrier protein] reductase
VAYSAAKAGMVGMSRALALEVGHKGITVNCVAPGWVATASQTEVEASRNAYPHGACRYPEEMAAAIVFLAMPAASYIHGEMLVVDGANCLQERKG